jgi:hypothetical protein
MVSVLVLVACGEVRNNNDGGADADVSMGTDGGTFTDASPDDMDPPETTIDSGPGTPTNQTSVTFEFSSDEAGSTFQCRLDGGAYADCSSPHDLTASDEGSHMFEVYAIDGNDNADDSPAMHTWVVDTTAPEITISTGPSNPTSSTDADFTFTTNEDSSLECRLDSGSYVACTSPHGYTGAGNGDHSFWVRATDLAGNTAEASYDWTVDQNAPSIMITDGPDTPTNSTSAAFTFSAEAGTTVACRLDNGGFGGCNSSTTHSYNNLGANTDHTFYVRATDMANNSATAQYSWTIDTQPPIVTILTYPANPTASAAAAFTFSSNETATFECSLDSPSNYSTCDTNGSHSYNSVGVNTTHTFRARATDAAGNAGIGNYVWIVDQQAPTTTINAAPANPYPVDYADFTFSSNDNNASYECRMDNGSFVDCSSPISYDTLGYSSHTFAVRATDTLGNVETSYPTHTWSAQPGLLLHYPFDGDLRNYSALGAVHDGDGNDIDFIQGVFDGALKTLPTDQSFAKLPGTVRPMSNDFRYTVGFWVREVSWVSDLEPRYFINFLDAPSNGAGGGVSISVRYGNDHELTVAAGMDNASHNQTVSYNTWQGWAHILVEYIGLSLSQGREVRVYRDGQPWLTVSNPTNGVVFSPFMLPDILVGQNNDVVIDDLRVFNQVFDEEERCEQVIGGAWISGNDYCQLPLPQ